jgi:lipid-A-disaccharide synthase-like uncharacterized protein
MAVELLPLAALLAPEGLTTSGWVQAVGWTGQGFYFVRVMIQWIASERAKRPVAPRIFWYFSAAGAVFGSSYCFLREEFVMLPGFLMTLGIYLRNLWISSRGPETGRASPLFPVAVALLVAAGSFVLWLNDEPSRTAPSGPWLALGVAGQACWIGRFLVQWSHAERHGKSEFPPAFWWLTIAGGSLNTAYSLYRVDLPLIFGFVMSWVAPARNLMLHRKHQRSSS